MSRRFTELKSSIIRIRNALLPEEFNPTGEYRDAKVVHLRTASFLFLCHAEIESYIEEIALGLHQETWQLWQTYRWPSHGLTCLLGFSEVATSLPPEGLAATGSSYSEVAVPLEKANNAWRFAHRYNNGVKEKDILRLLLPIGIPASVLDQTLLNDLNSFGSARGDIAHRSPTSVTNLLDPQTEFASVNLLVDALQPLDEFIHRETLRLRRISRKLSAEAV